MKNQPPLFPQGGIIKNQKLNKMPLYPKQEPPYYTEQNNAAGTKIYQALISQTGTSIPTVTILQNTLGYTPSFTYEGVGSYTLTAPTGSFLANKQFYTINANDNMLIYMRNIDEQTFSIRSYNDYDGTTPANDLLDNTPIQITVYP